MYTDDDGVYFRCTACHTKLIHIPGIQLGNLGERVIAKFQKHASQNP